MSDDDREPSSDPFGSPDSERGERGMTYFGATAWTLLAFLGTYVIGGILLSLRRSSSPDITSLVGVQTVVTLLVLFLILQVHAPELSIRHFLGLRRTHFAFYPLAGALGALAHLPANALLSVIEKYYPSDPASEQYMYDQLAVSTPRRIAVCLAIAVVGPFVEEVFYRGAIFRPLRRGSSAWSAIVVTSMLFALVHVEWQRMIPIGLLGMMLALFRASSGSLVPGFIMHATFNGISLWAMLEGGLTPPENPESLPIHVTIAGTLFTFVLLGVAHKLGERTEAAREARAEDLA
jgi:membrane protease YdiL (CAAX protease family)